MLCAAVMMTALHFTSLHFTLLSRTYSTGRCRGVMVTIHIFSEFLWKL